MLFAMLGLLMATGSTPTRTVSIDPAAGTKVRIECPTGQTTRIVLPERLKKLVSAPAAARTSLGIRVEKSQPEGVVLVTPQEHPYTGVLTVTGASVSLTLELHTTSSGVASEVRLQLARPTAVAGGATASTPTTPPPAVAARGATPAAPIQGSEAVPSVEAQTPVPVPSAAPETATAEVDFNALASAEARRIDRREGRPGQRPCVLEEVLRNDTHAWFRLRLIGGAEDRVESVQSGDTAVRAFATEVAGKDLKIVVQVPRAEVKDNRLALRLGNGTVYRFSLNRNTIFNSFFKNWL